MTAIRANCHGASYVQKQLDEGDLVVKDRDKIMAEAVRVIQGMYEDNILKKPMDWTVASDRTCFSSMMRRTPLNRSVCDVP